MESSIKFQMEVFNEEFVSYFKIYKVKYIFKCTNGREIDSQMCFLHKEDAEKFAAKHDGITLTEVVFLN